jgi:uncharacterized protein (DUF924 family)
MALSISPADVTAFWRDAGPKAWFAHDPAFDTRFRERFLEAHLAAARRELDAWGASAQGSLALVILLDQFPRNAFRGSGHMYATDGLARWFARRAIDAGHDRQIEAALRLFIVLPFSHSESLADQELAVQLHAGVDAEAARYAAHHRDIVQRFGRFPHRNPMLGRETTAEEAEFLRAGGFSG